MYQMFAAVLAAASCATLVQAQRPPSADVGIPFTLEQALRLANGASPSIDAADAGVRASAAARTVAGLRPNPSIEVQSENLAGSGAYRGLSGAETTVGMSLPIELGGKRPARIAVAEAQGSRARIGAVITRADVRLAVTQAYIDAAAAERRLTIARDQLAVAEEGRRVAGTRVQAGAASPIDLQRADVLAINARVAFEAAQRNVVTARTSLGRLISQPVAGTLDLAWFDRIEGAGPHLPARAEGTLALAAANAEVATADAQVRLARSQRVPDLTISAGARRLEATNDVAAVVGVSVPIPFFNTGRAAVGQARAQRDQADAQRRAALVEAERAIAAAEAEVANAAAKARAAGGPALAAAQEAARIARIGYAQGKFGQIELLEAERTLTETRAQTTDALATYHDAQARLERLTVPAGASVSGDDR